MAAVGQYPPFPAGKLAPRLVAALTLIEAQPDQGGIALPAPRSPPSPRRFCNGCGGDLAKGPKCWISRALQKALGGMGHAQIECTSMPAYSIQQAQAQLPSLIRRVERGEVITITRAQIPVAMLVRVGSASRARRLAPPNDAWSDAPHEGEMPAWHAFPWGGSVVDGGSGAKAEPGGGETETATGSANDRTTGGGANEAARAGGSDAQQAPVPDREPVV